MVTAPRPTVSRSAAGFTLIELMIAVAIVAILARIAYPSYTSYVRRGQIQEALSTLSNNAVLMEQYFQDNKAYGATSGTTCGMTLSTSGTQYFTYSCVTSSSAQGFTLTATGASGAVSSGNYVYTINHSGTKATLKFAGTDTSATLTNCWATRSAAACD